MLSNAFLLLEDLRGILKTASFPTPVSEPGQQPNQMDMEHPWSGGGNIGADGPGQEHGGKRQGGRREGSIPGWGCRGSSLVSFDLYLVRTVFLYFLWNGMCPVWCQKYFKIIFLKKKGKGLFI